mgnify:CR=1 FL=1
MKKDLENFVIDWRDTIESAMLKITANRYRVVIVLDGNKVIGTVSDGDIRRAFLRQILSIAPVEKIMNINCRTTTERDPQKIREIIKKEKVTVLPIVDEENQLLDIALAYEPFTD